MNKLSSLASVVGAFALALVGACAFAQSSAGSSPNYPAVGHVYNADLGVRTFVNDYRGGPNEMVFTRKQDGHTGTVHYTAVELRPKLFMVYWIESDGTSVTRFEDFEKDLVYVNITGRDGNFFNLRGTFKQVE